MLCNVVPATFNNPVTPMVVVAARGAAGGVGVTVTVTVAEEDKVVTELLVAALDVPRVPKLHTKLVVFEELTLLQVPVPELELEVPALVLAESSELAAPKVEAVKMPPFTGSPVL